MRSLLLASVAVLSATAAWAQVMPLGPVFQINTYTIDDQAIPSVAADAAGNFVVVWQSQWQDGSGYGIFGQRYDATGVPRGLEFQVNTYTTGDQWRRAALASDGAGNFTVVWGNHGAYFDAEVVGQRFDASGNRAGNEFQANSATTGEQYQPSIASDVNGNFVVVWQSFRNHGPQSDPNALSGQRYAPTGLPVGAEFRIDSYQTGMQVLPAVTMHDGGFVVAWKEFDLSGASYDHLGVFVKPYDPAGTPGSEVQANSCLYGSTGAFGRPAVASLGTGGFVVVWSRPGPVFRVEAQIFGANGFVAGREIEVGYIPVSNGEDLSLAVVADGPDHFAVLWKASGGLSGRTFNSAGIPTSAQFLVADSANSASSVPGAVIQAPGSLVVVWSGSSAVEYDGILGRRFGGLGSELEQLNLDLDPTGNRVMEGGELVPFVPGWRNPTASPIAATGALSGFIGPEGALYSIVDGDAQYGVIAPGQRADCATAADCYSLSVRASLRPAQHWDATVDETLSTGTTRTWPLHIGDSFSDVPRTRPDYVFVEGLLHHGVTAGCGAGLYCPDSPISRGEMAVYLRAAREGAEACRPVGCNGSPRMFADVPNANPFCGWIEELARYAVVTGCGGGNFCPDASVTREQMAVFVLGTREGPGYAPPACTAGLERFDDVPASSGFCPWIEELARRNVVTGCGGDLYCPTAAVTRGDMSVFVTVTFGLPLYGP